MITNYAEKTDGWKPWQVKYKYGVILIFPPEPHRAKITALRNRYRWTQGCDCDAHISLTVPIPRPMLQNHLDEIAVILLSISAFRIDYGPIIEKPIRPGVLLKIIQQDELRAIVNIVESTSVFSGATARGYPYWAHMTIAEMASDVIDDEELMQQSYQIMKEIEGVSLTGNFLLKRVSYAVPDENFTFTERARLELKQ